MPRIQELAQNNPRLVAAIWFAIAGSIIPVWFASARRPDSPVSLFIFFLLPILAAGLAGWIRGWRILDPATVNSGSKGFTRGCTTSLLGFVFFALAFAISLGIDEFGRDQTAGELMKNIFGGILLVFGVGGMYLAIPIIIIGGTAGWLLYRLFAPHIGVREQNISENDPAIE